VPYALALALIAVWRRGADIDVRAPNPRAALAEVLRVRGLDCDEADVIWVAGPSGVRGAVGGGGRALVRANARGETKDLYLVDARLSPEGALLEVGGQWNVTRSIGVDEGRPIVRGSLAAYLTSSDGTTTGVHTLDVGGHAIATYTDFTPLQRWQVGLTNLQQTGRTTGVTHVAFALDPPASQASLAFEGNDRLGVVADGRRIVIDPAQGVAIEGGGWVRAAPETKARPGNLVTWSVDRVRAMPWFGEEKMQVVKAVAFTALDWLKDTDAKVFGDTSARQVAEDLGALADTRVTYTDPEIGWPPAPMKPLITPPLPGEGAWISLDRDPFLSHTEGTPVPFVTSFIRSDRQKPQTRIYVTMWDPRQVALHMEAGTVEPVSATGEAGPGVIPRTPEVLRRVVGGFNGGFQALHGEYGMEANGIVYLPPKPYAATILELRDGTTAMGAWPGSTDIPDEILSYRQNMTALVQNDRFNPWGRTWWGGTPQGWHDNVHTTRSGVCLTKENFAGYFWGNDISADVLAQAMLLARCAFGVHLDMNPGLAGFEFYNVQPKATWKPLGRPLQQDWEWEGTFRELPDFHVRARRMIKGMSHMNFPQYIHRDGRDFFYLTQRPVLPGEKIVPHAADGKARPPDPGEGAWRVQGLPQHGFPYAVATAWARVDDEHKVRVLRVDPRTVRAAASAGTTEGTPTIVSFEGTRRARPGELAVWLGDRVFLSGAAPPSPDALAIAVGSLPGSPEAASARAMVGIQDEDGMLDWIELPPDATPSAALTRAMDALLASMGCSARIALAGDARALLAGTLDVAGEPTSPPRTAVARLVRGDAPSARPYFTSTPIVSPSVWQPLQSQRVRYFQKPKKAASDAGAPAPGGASDAGH